MKHLGDRALDLAKSALLGYLTVFVVCLFAVVVLLLATFVTGPTSLNIGVGPLPLVSMWNSPLGNGFETQWGLVALSVLGAVAGLGLGLRRQVIRPA
jgi:hypothetical protein